ncbi:hypothetical protein [Kouleothrix sp.]|uniref:hypothetical protein n=1 Tax=Kouleothrix sp. TaxID=2779161 RepID=UPI003918C8F9
MSSLTVRRATALSRRAQLGQHGAALSGARGLIKLGTQLEQLCKTGRRDMLLVALFIKVGAFQWL